MAVPAVPVGSDGVAVVDLNDTVLKADHRAPRDAAQPSCAATLRRRRRDHLTCRVTVRRGGVLHAGRRAARPRHAQPDEPEHRLQVDPQVDTQATGAGRPPAAGADPGVGLARTQPWPSFEGIDAAGRAPSHRSGRVPPTGAPTPCWIRGPHQASLYQLPGTPRAETLLSAGSISPRPPFDPLGWVWSTNAACTGAVTRRHGPWRGSGVGPRPVAGRVRDQRPADQP